mmetsp:Transcript_34585/g.70586  ORF Transcript_34585/g.70586 Transcript_34585/m.70586 type:complete len:269 (-) Transcript_34585:38-844(-)
MREGWRRRRFGPGRGRRERRRRAEDAEAAIAAASEASPPPRLRRDGRRAGGEALLDMLEEELTGVAPLLRQEEEARYFPTELVGVSGGGDGADPKPIGGGPLIRARRRADVLGRRMSKATARQTERLAALGRGGAVSYGFLNFAWYTLAVALQWRRHASPVSPEVVVLPSLVPGAAAAALGASVRKFGRVLLAAYVGSQVTKLPRIYLAMALAPWGDRLLRWTERRFGVGEKKAFAIVTGSLIAGCLGIWAALIFGNAMWLSLGSFNM